MNALQKAEAALSLLKAENEPISILKICRTAGVNRANLYQSYPEFVEKVRALQPGPNRKRKLATDKLSQQLKREEATTMKDLKEENKALLYLCLRLKVEVEELKEQLRMRDDQKKKVS